MNVQVNKKDQSFFEMSNRDLSILQVFLSLLVIISVAIKPFT